ncbi:hypothetical protein SAMN04515673_102324 [Poseidonocella sedimentorum]|uniref:Uncharacterized protein n=1 Tax=Poseidonocella sedimentorum TaxID=871652 RepID=A0A1I6D7L8_9RHOB|nr:hypothetical protein SAMN04515673_102324 [Poseidonocella sedimentorum]
MSPERRAIIRLMGLPDITGRVVALRDASRRLDRAGVRKIQSGAAKLFFATRT